MPSGIYQRDKTPGIYGRKPDCICGTCGNCKQRVRNRRHYAKRRVELDDAELELKLMNKFKSMGWD